MTVVGQHKLQPADPAHEVAYQDLCALVSKHASKLTPIELLAIASNMLGKLLAMQDQRVTTVAMANEVIALNIEEGNRQVIDGLLRGKGGTA